MAPHRLLMQFKSSLPLFILLLASVYVACGPTGEIVIPDRDNNTDNSGPEAETTLPGEDDSGLMILSLADYYNTQSNEIPEAFQELKVQKEVEVDLTKGFRIQIYSGQSLEFADTTAMHFRAWSDTTLVGYQPETYTFFKTPYYRVHVGDFHDRERALALSRIIKRFFRDAWVVYDTVDPYAVPADTARITIR